MHTEKNYRYAQKYNFIDKTMLIQPNDNPTIHTIKSTLNERDVYETIHHSQTTKTQWEKP